MRSTNNALDSPRILILGGGFAGAYCAQALEKKKVFTRADLLLVDRNNFLTFYPLLVEAGTGSLEPRHVVVPIRGFLKQTEFKMAEIANVDLRAKSVTYATGKKTTHTARYDHLVLALGSVTRLPNLPGLDKYGFQIKSLTDAVRLRDRAIQMLERANATEDAEERRALLRLTIVGGNFTGIELAGEFQHFMETASRFYPNVAARECQVSVIEITDRILPALDRSLSAYAARRMRKRGIEILLEETIREVKPDSVVLKGRQTIPTKTVIWCAGVAPNPLISKLSVPVDERGYILCERDLRVEGFESVWAIGDCAVNTDSEGRPYPATAQHAVQEAKYLAENLKRALKGSPTLPCDISSRGALAAIGCRTGVAKVFGVKLSGFPAWFLYRTAYLLKMPGWSRKVRVALDWTIGLFFSRDFVQLGIHGD